MNNLYKTAAFYVQLVLLMALFGTAVAQPLNGNYTIYGAGANYATLSDAASALNSQGVSGPVVFKVRPGTWSSSSTSSAVLNSITGASATNTITFEAENGNAATTTITNTNTSSSTTTGNFIFRFNSAKYIKVRNLTLDKTSSSYGTVLRFEGSASNNLVENCVIEGSTSSSTSTNMARIYGSGLGSAENNKIKNNTIDRGSMAVYWYGSSSSNLSEDNEFEENTITQPYYYGFYTYYTKNLKIKNNTITRSGSGTFYGFYTWYADGAFEISGNTLTSTSATSTNYPMYFYYCDGTSTERGSISNNNITVSSSTSIYNYIYYSNYYSISGNKIDLTSSSTIYPLYNYNYNSSTAFGYGKDCYIENNEITATTNSTIYLYGHYYYQQNPKFNNNKITFNGGSGTQYIYGGYYYQYNMEFNGNTIKMDGTSGSKYLYAGYYYSRNNFEFSNNDVEINSTTGSIYHYVGYYQIDNTGYAKYNNNKVRLKTTSSGGSYNYFAYYNTSAEITGNDIESRSGTSTAYGMYAYGYSGGAGPWIIKNNRIVAESGGSGTVYGLYNYYANNLDLINNSIYVKSSGFRYAYLGGYNSGGARVYNNTMHTAGGNSSTAYTLYIYESSGSQSASIYNNMLSRDGGSGYLTYMYTPTYYEMDYNNLYADGGTMVYYGGTGQNYTTISALRAGTGQNMNSLTYAPAYMNVSNGDLRPDATSANSWSMNGRGVQFASNGTDMLGNPRATTTIDGVPDLGAYEFTPTSTPPSCVATPATPTASSSQTFTFGEDTVAVYHWGTTVPSTLDIKQYTGTNPPGILSINPTQMFYYFDATSTGTSTGLNFTQDLYYKDAWMGTIASEAALRLAEKPGASAWSGYAPSVSSSNTARNFIHTPNVPNGVSLFTGIDVKDNAGADGIIDPTPPFCPGTYTVKMRIKNNGNNIINKVKIAWELNGVAQTPIVYNTPININGSVQGNEAIIPLGNITFGSTGVNIKAWTYEPNGNQDPVPGDDTSNVNYRAALQGTYTVGGTTPNFATPVDAVDALNSFGTCGNVTFNIRPGTYTGQLVINNPQTAGTPGRVTFQSENGVASTTTINYGTSNNGVIELRDADNFTFKNLTVTTTSTGHSFGLHGGSDRDSIVGCVLNAPNAGNTYNSCIFAYSQYTNFNGEDLVVKGNEINGGYYTVWIYSSSTPINRPVVDNNTIKNAGYMGAYLYRTNGLVFTNNTLDNFTTNGYYGAYIYYPYQSPNISNNTIEKDYGYGMLVYYAEGSSSNRAKIMNNAIAMTTGSTAYYGMMVSYGQYQDIANNSVNFTNNNTTGYAGYFYYSSSTYNNNNFYNNVFCNTGGGPALLYYNLASNNNMDYNNIYATGSTFASYNGSTVSSFSAWKSASSSDKNSITYDPGFTSSTDLRPDATNPASWSLNGRALQIAGNNKDRLGSARIDDVKNGTPDIGAYEFTPTVEPPVATAVPASANPGDVQVFTFGEQQIARVKWGTQLPITAPLVIRQYSGEKGAGIAAAAAPKGSMYFYTTVQAQGTSTIYDFDLDLNYMDIWMGTISNESELRLAHKFNSNYQWMLFSGTLSSVNTGTNVISGTSLIHYGAFTGLENGSITSAFVRPLGKAVICTGNSVTLSAEPVVAGNTYQWYKNNVILPSATSQTYTANQAGDYSVVITNGSKSVEAVPLTVSTVAPPNALVSANGPLTYCIGNGLTLSAGNGQGLKYQWQLNGVDIAGATNNTYQLNQAGNYTVVVTNIGCSTSSPVTPVTSGPIKVDLGNDTSYCEKKNVYLVLNAGYPGAKYTWSTGDTTRQIAVTKSGNYTVTVNGGPNCIATDDINVNIDPLPRSNGISYVKNGNEYTFNPAGPAGVIGYLWLFSDGTTSTQQYPKKTLNGELYVRLVMYNQCGSDTSQLGFPLNVEGVANNFSVDLYPNPASNKVTVKVQGATMESVQILNSVGMVVYGSEVGNDGKEHSANISALPNGHYTLRAVVDNGYIISKPFNILR
ncbi:MAG: right-handed parallel beta-helix repeat-containing protein [Flavipsychrobacter sp.]